MLKISIFILTIGIVISCNKTENFTHPLQALENSDKVMDWVSIENMICRDGSPTGVGVRIKDHKKLAIYINGGGACFNTETCASNPKNFNQNDLERLASSYTNKGIFNIEDERNPIKDFSLVFVPYCTGDVHSGNKPNGYPLDMNEPQQYVGANNFKLVLDYIQPYFEHEGVEEILFFGLSAGGYGVYINFLELIKAFPNAKITIINDSGPLLDEASFPLCLQLGFKYIFNLPVPDDLLLNSSFPELGLTNVYEYASKKYPNVNMAFLSSNRDNVSRFFLSFGQNGCSGITGNSIPDSTFKKSIYNLNNNILIPKTKWSSFIIDSDSHTMLATNSFFYEKQIDGIYLYQFVDEVMHGKRLNLSE